MAIFSTWKPKDFFRIFVCIVFALLLSRFVLIPYLDHWISTSSVSLEDTLDKNYSNGISSRSAGALPNSVSANNSTFNSVKTEEPKRSAADVAIVDDWFKRSGYGSQDEATYKAYSDLVLENLISNGDIRAMYEMGTRKLASGDLGAAKVYMEKGIVYGSRGAINGMVAYTYPHGESYPYDEAKQMLKENFAYMSLLVLRGDSFRGHERDSSMRLFEKSYKVKNPLTAEDEAWIQARAKELYDHYQSERNKLGLGDFDNETPKEVKEFLGAK